MNKIYSNNNIFSINNKKQIKLFNLNSNRYNNNNQFKNNSNMKSKISKKN